MKFSFKFFLTLLIINNFTLSAFALASGIPSSERIKVRQVAQLMDRRYPARIDGATKQCYLEIMDVKEQVEALGPSTTPNPDMRINH